MPIQTGTNSTVTKHTGIGSVRSVTKDPFTPMESGRTLISAKTYVIPTSDVNNSDFIVEWPQHGFSDGEPIMYHSMGGANILRNISVMQPQTSEINLTDDTINDANLAHGCETGDIIYYNKGASSAAIGGLTHGTDYYIIKVDDNTIKLAATYDNALTETSIDLHTSVGDGAHQIYKYFQDNETFYAGHVDGQDSRFYLFDNQTTATTGTGDGSGAIIMNDSLKGNNNQVFSTSFGRLDPTTDT